MDYQRPNSNWIWIGENYDKENPVTVYFRKELELDEKPERALVKLTADSRYRFFVNGVSLCQGPCKGDDQIWYYDEVDMAPYLKEGKNVLSAIVLRYPTVHGKGNDSVWRTEHPCFYLDGVLECGGEQTPITTGEDWQWHLADHVQTARSNDFFEPLCITETASGVAELAGWQQPEYEEIRQGGGVTALPEDFWQPAVAYGQMSGYVSPGRLAPRPIPFLYEVNREFTEVMRTREGSLTKEQWENWLRQNRNVAADADGGNAPTSTHCSIHIPAHSREVVELHAGEETTGYLELVLAGGRGSSISITCAESYLQPVQMPEERLAGLPEQMRAQLMAAMLTMRPDKEDRLDCENGIIGGPVDRYTVAGYGTEDQPEYYEPFWFRTFRFIKLEIETDDEPLDLCSFTYRETGYPLEVKTRVETSDASLSDIWDICERTLRRCMHETYEDCPYYEQLQYIMDTRSQILYTYMTSADDRLARKCIEDFARSQRYDGLLEGCYPSYGPNTIVNFSIYYILMVRDHFLYFGDRAFTERFLPVLERIVLFYKNQLTEQGLVRKTSEGGQGGRYWSFIDWVDTWQEGVPNALRAGEVTMESLLYCLGLQQLADLERYFANLGYGGLAEQHEREAEALKASIRKHCMDDRGLLMDGPGFAEYSQHCQVFGTLTGLFTPEEARAAMETAMADETFAKCSVSMRYYLFRALEQVDMYELTDGQWELWREMLRAHLTTCVESRGIKGRSDCHAWGALALYELPAVVLGVRPTKPGFAEYEVRPVPGYLSWAKGDVITPRGMIHVEWTKQEDGSLDVKVETAENLLLK